MQKTIIVVSLLALPFLANAQEIYKRVQEDGTVEYSDVPFPDSQQIEVNPNVVEITPDTRPQPSSERAEVHQESRAPEDSESDDNDNVYINTNDRDRVKRSVIHENQQQEQNRPSTQPRKGGAAGGR